MPIPEQGESDTDFSSIRPHTLPPQQLYLSHLAPSLTQTSLELQSQRAAIQTENAEILARVMQQRREIAAMVQALEKAVEDVDGSAAALGEAGLEEGLKVEE